MIRYKTDIVELLKYSGYNFNKLRNEKLLSSSVLTALHNNKYVSLAVIDKICALLQCQPGDILEYTPD